MLPTYHNGDMVISIKQSNYQIGDIAVYHPKDLECQKCNVVHRIVGQETDGRWITQGDNNHTHDPWYPTNDEIRGTVIFHASLGASAIIFLSPFFWLTILFTGLSIITVTYFLYYKKQTILESEEKNDSLQ